MSFQNINIMQPLGLIKLCVDPHCDAVWHNCPKKQTRCKDCDGRIIIINEKTFWEKFSKNWFQYDYETNEYFRPVKENKQLSLNFE